ncbi:MAG TPA: vWA domain-containing protein [Candidatus Nitrosotalea sp.]|nr:vWA domain-containing protein [Candidatus Nitrosotalea sp.]
MHSLQIRTDTLLEIGTFLVRRWSGNEEITLSIKDQKDIQTKLRENKIIIFPLDRYHGTDFQKYRQFRTALWYESMRIRHSSKILSNDHAFGFILNTLDTRRIETVGRKYWQGMDEEIIFNYGFAWLYRPLLNSLYGHNRIVEGFVQYFLLGDIKGEIQPSAFEKIQKASAIAHEAVKEAVEKEYGADWLEKKVSEIIKILEIDPLLTIPISMPKIMSGIAMSEKDFTKTLSKVARYRESDFGELDTTKISEGKQVFEEFKVLLEETKRNENKGLTTEVVGISIPNLTNVDETKIYDMDLINNLKAKFKEWKSGWKEQHVISGDEFDQETYMEGHKPFVTDKKIAIKTRIFILLDHSSSIAEQETQYKKATLALCEVLDFLKVRFSVYAFNTEQKQVTCWLIKPESLQWNNASTKRLAQIKANGSTPLAEVYNLLLPTLRSKKPDIFLTLTDGEPSDPDAVRAVMRDLKLLGIKMVAIGVGPDTGGAITIANNLRRLGYERTLAVSRLNEIPKRVLNVLGTD